MLYGWKGTCNKLASSGCLRFTATSSCVHSTLFRGFKPASSRSTLPCIKWNAKSRKQELLRCPILRCHLNRSKCGLLVLLSQDQQHVCLRHVSIDQLLKQESLPSAQTSGCHRDSADSVDPKIAIYFLLLVWDLVWSVVSRSFNQ